MYICNKRVEVENTLHLLLLYMEKEKTKEGVLEGWVPIYDGIYLPVSHFRRNNQGII